MPRDEDVLRERFQVRSMTYARPPGSRRLDFGLLAHEFSRFLAVGVATTAVHYGVLVVLVELWGAGPVAGTTAGFITATLLSYLLNRRYTFSQQPTFGPGLVKYYAAVSVGLVINAGVMAGATKLGLHYLWAQVLASGAALIWNFLAARFVVFRDAGEIPPHHGAEPEK